MSAYLGTNNASQIKTSPLVNPSANNNPSGTDDPQNQFLQDVYSGLEAKHKSLPCKYFYDQTGSDLFEAICELDEYYLTRTELSLLKRIRMDLAELIGKNASIIEPGAGAGIKIQTLLQALDSPSSYVPMDISKDFLFASARIIQARFPHIDILPIQGDFTRPIKLLDENAANNHVVFFPGSTIGNFEKSDAVNFLANMAKLVGQSGAIIVGADLIKDAVILEAAYDDSLGVTAKFNKNLLVRINTELAGNFKLNQFEHLARYNSNEERVEIFLRSKTDQTVRVRKQDFSFKKNELIHTENSHKYSIKSFEKIAQRAGLNVQKIWCDDKNYFGIFYLTVKTKFNR